MKYCRHIYKINQRQKVQAMKTGATDFPETLVSTYQLDDITF